MPSTFRQAADAVDDIKDDLEDNLSEQLEKGMESTESEMKRQLRGEDAVASGTLLASITTVPNPPADRAFSSQQIIAAPHWAYVEFGTGLYGSPKRNYKAPDVAAPFDIIEQWVVDKGIVPDPDGPYDTQRELAEAIAFSLSTGTPMQKFARPAWHGPRGWRGIVNRLKTAMQYTFARHM